MKKLFTIGLMVMVSLFIAISVYSWTDDVTTYSGGITLGGDLTAVNVNGVFDGIVEETCTDWAVAHSTLTTSQFGFVDVTYGTCTVVLPAVSGTAGKKYTIKHSTTTTATVTIDGNGAETIDGSATNTDLDTDNDCLTVISDGSEWHIIQRYIQ